LLSHLEDRKTKFAESHTFIAHKSVFKIKELVEIVGFLSGNQNSKILHATQSLSYEHDKFEYSMRVALHRIMSLAFKNRRYLSNRKKFYLKSKPKLFQLFQSLSQTLLRSRMKMAIGFFHAPLDQMTKEKAITVIQKNWRGYKLRRMYTKIKAKLKKKQ
jgi:hypothetical protein